MINKIGVFLFVLGSVLTILLIITIFSGILVPTEMTIVYLIEFFERGFHILLPISILMLLIGIKISSIRTYTPTDLILEMNKISFIKNGVLVEIPEPRLHKIMERKALFSKLNRIKIKTDTHKEYDIKGTGKILEHLTELFPNKTEIKNVG